MELLLLIIIIVIIALGGFWVWRGGRGTERAQPPASVEQVRPDDADVRCVIRAAQGDASAKSWVNVAIQLTDIHDRDRRTYRFDQISTEQMVAFETRLRNTDWRKHAEGSSDQSPVPAAFPRKERTVIYVRDVSSTSSA
ncbi:MAG: hypothetical protein ACOCX3_02715 [Chloroflexota bacterium]